MNGHFKLVVHSAMKCADDVHAVLLESLQLKIAHYLQSDQKEALTTLVPLSGLTITQILMSMLETALYPT